MKHRVAEFKAKMVSWRENARGQKVLRLCVDEENTVGLMQTLASYLGHFKHADSFNLVKRFFANNLWLGEYFYFSQARLSRKHVRKGAFRSLKSQVAFFRAGLPQTLLLLQVGQFIEAYDQDALTISKIFGFRNKKGFRGMQIVAGFPRWLEKNVTSKLLDRGQEFALIKEGQTGPFIRQRDVRIVYRMFNTHEKEI